MRAALSLFVLMMGLAACSPALLRATPQRSYQIIEQVVVDDFAHIGRWDRYDADALRIGVLDGSLEINSSLPNYVWTLDRREQSNSVIQVTTTYLSAYEKGIYGLICRASPQNDGSGYFFLVSADGAYSIRRGAGSAIDALVPWQNGGGLRRGQATNELRAVCIDDYLALYINGEFVADVRDDRYRSGFTGLAAALAPRAAAEDRVFLRFSDLRIFSAR